MPDRCQAGKSIGESELASFKRLTRFVALSINTEHTQNKYSKQARYLSAGGVCEYVDL